MLCLTLSCCCFQWGGAHPQWPISYEMLKVFWHQFYDLLSGYKYKLTQTTRCILDLDPDCRNSIALMICCLIPCHSLSPIPMLLSPGHHWVNSLLHLQQIIQLADLRTVWDKVSLEFLCSTWIPLSVCSKDC